MTNKIEKLKKEIGGNLYRITISQQQQQLTNFWSTVSTHKEFARYYYRRNRGNNDHMVRGGNDQSVNYFAKTSVNAMNNALNRNSVVCFMNEYCNVIIQHFEKKYYINGNMVTKSRLNGIIPAIMMRLNICKSQEKMDKIIDLAVVTDPIISSAIVNKIEYTFYNKGEKVVTLLNLEKTSKETSAIELYEGLWCDFKDSKIKSFINSCRGNKNKYLGISPEELHYESRGEFLTDSQVQVVYAFLEQNRKSSLVEKRSMELFKDLTERFKGKIFEVQMNVESADSKAENAKQAMAVKGKILDWVVVDRGYKRGRQDVSTYALIPMSNYRKLISERGTHRWTCKKGVNKLVPDISNTTNFWTCKTSKELYYAIGPICIDQAHSGVSLGDQFAARSMALLNDIHSCSQVSTLRGYEKYKPELRVDWDAVSLLQRSEKYK
tara:strand:- start:2059 stop:3366 length:1308 start_codon:yes stop_codon:yes gene_type:complete